MKASSEITIKFEMDEDEFRIFNRLITKLKTTPQKIGFKKNEFDEEEQSMIDGMYDFGEKLEFVHLAE